MTEKQTQEELESMLNAEAAKIAVQIADELQAMPRAQRRRKWKPSQQLIEDAIGAVAMQMGLGQGAALNAIEVAAAAFSKRVNIARPTH